MITLNPFVENNKARINQFLNNLCEVGDFYDTLEVCGVDFSAESLADWRNDHRWTNTWHSPRRTFSSISPSTSCTIHIPSSYNTSRLLWVTVLLNLLIHFSLSLAVPER